MADHADSKTMQFPTLKKIVIHMPENVYDEAMVSLQSGNFISTFLVDYDDHENRPKPKEAVMRELVGTENQGTLLMPSYDSNYASVTKYGSRLIATNDYYIAEYDRERGVWALLAIRGYPNYMEFFKIQLVVHEVHMQMLIRPGKGLEAVVMGAFVKTTVPVLNHGDGMVIAGSMRAEAVHFSKNTVKVLYGQAGVNGIFAQTDRRSFSFDSQERFFKCRKPNTRNSILAQYWYNDKHELVLL